MLKENIQTNINKLKDKTDLIAQLQSELIQDSANIEKIKSDLAIAEQKYQDK